MVTYSQPNAEDRIAVLSDGLADQIAAGEVVERPASVVKELVENAIDAGASRIDVTLKDGGATLIRVVDDGRGMHESDLELAVTRHATSKISQADHLSEIVTLGFRGEALASIAAVARIRLQSRRGGTGMGHELVSIPGEERRRKPVGMPEGTVIEVEHLFAAIPARRKFLRSEATEVGHCSDAIIRASLVHPEVAFRLQHGPRVLFDFPAGTAARRVAQILERRGPGPFHAFEGEEDGVRVQGWLAPPSSASRQGNAAFIVVRRRVVRERSLRKILGGAYADAIPPGRHPVACLWVEPAAGTVDVNVHPQKAEVRFSEPQRLYAAVRNIVSRGIEGAPWVVVASAPEMGEGVGGSHGPDQTARTLASWDARAGGVVPERQAPRGGGATYRLSTRAAGHGYSDHKRAARAQADQLRASLPGAAARAVAVTPERAEEPTVDQPELLTVLAGPTAIFRHRGELLAVDLRRLRSHLVEQRLLRELGGNGVAAQGLLQPVVVSRSAPEVELCGRGHEALAELGFDVTPFGDDAVAVRALPAQLGHCVDAESVTALLDRVVPWLRMREERGAEAAEAGALMSRVSSVSGRDPAPRLARRWLAEVAARSDDLASVPGIRRWTVSDLTGDP